MQDTAAETSSKAMKSLQTRLRLTRAAIVLERAVRCFWLAASWLLLVLAVIRVGLLADAKPLTLSIILIVAAICGVYLLFKAVGAFHWPSRTDAISRLDQTLAGRPLQTLGDTQAIGTQDAASKHLWAKHLQRMAEAANKSTAAKPDLRLARRDPWALRLMAIFLFASALIFARVDPVQSLVNSLNPNGQNIATGPSFEGWAEPPSYTGKPAIYLNKIESGTVLELPQGSQITLRIYGGSQSASLMETVTETGDTTLSAQETDLAETTFEITKSGIITVSPNTGPSVSWSVIMTPDQPPTVELTGEITRTVQGALKMPFHATDDYGVIGGKITISLQLDRVDRRHGLALDPEAQEQVTLDLPLPFNRATDDFTQTLVEDLAEHPWAGLPVKITLQVRDDAGQVGAITPLTTTMPGKRFFDKLANAVAEQRRDLLWNRDNSGRITMILRAITHQPDTIFDDEKAYLVIRTALRRLEYNSADGLSDEIRDEVAELLWNAALLIEDGDLSDARERLKRAQERLSDAMENGATDEEIAELMEELRKASKQYMRQLAREQRENPDRQTAEDQPRMEVSQAQLQQMMDRIQELMEQGRMDEAQELMQQLQQMMENMQVTENGQGEDGEPGEQDMENMRDTLRQQQELADETFRQRQDEFNRQRREQQQGQQQNGNQKGQQQNGDRQGQQQLGNQAGRQGNSQQQGDQPGQSQGQNSDGQAKQGQGSGQNGQLNDLANRQSALRDLLAKRRDQLSTDGTKGSNEIEESLRRAEEHMDDAQESLQDGDTETTLESQARAMDSIRDGMHQLNDAMRRAESQDNQGQGQQGAGSRAQRRDPLGRDSSPPGVADLNGSINADDAYRRSREVMDEIRKRSGDRTRPELELDYLKRLLDRF